MAGIDYQGIALVIAAIGVALPAILVAINSFRTNAKLDVVHDLVNGQSAKLNAMSEAKGFVEGGDAERAQPTEPK